MLKQLIEHVAIFPFWKLVLQTRSRNMNLAIFVL